MSEIKRVTVGELISSLQQYSPETEVTFGSSTYSKRPLIFYRFKRRGADLLQIELSEIGEGCEPTPEIDNRITVGKILKQLSAWEKSNFVDFGSTTDAVPLELRAVKKVISFDLEQNAPPDWRYVNKDWE